MDEIDKKKLMKLTKAAEDIQGVLIQDKLNVSESISVLLAFTIDLAYAASIKEEQIKELYDGMWKGVKMARDKKGQTE